MTKKKYIEFESNEDAKLVFNTFIQAIETIYPEESKEYQRMKEIYEKLMKQL